MLKNQSPAHRYKEVAIKTANPLQLVVILYDAAIHALQKAQEQIKRNDIANRSQSINKCASIITELQACLNFKEGGEIAHSLDRLYDYMKRRIFKANVEQNAQTLIEVLTLLENLRSAWDELAAQAQVASVPAHGTEISDPGILSRGTGAAVPLNSLNISG